MGAKGQSGFPPFCRRIASIFYVVCIMFSVFLTCLEVSDYISGPKGPLPVKNIQTTTSQVYSHKLKVVGVEFLIPEQQRCSRYSEWPVLEVLVGKSVISGMSEAFVKKQDTVGWDPEPCHWLGRG